VSTQPTGTVSLLFSDVEGSTLLLQRLGRAYAEALDGQRRVQRAAWAAFGGTEMGTEGDSFYVAFPTAEAAVAAAVQAQRELAGFDWPGDEPVRVRMGIHTGAPAPHDGAYVGMDVHRAARIAAAAHGGQVLISRVTAALMDGSLPDGVVLRDLGSHQMKDIPRPEHLFQLAIDGLPGNFPPIRTLGASSSLPRPATPLVGRDGELAELAALLSSPQVRLVTLTGPGGSGKTRLAIGIAERMVERFADGVYFLPLAAVTGPDVMWTSIAAALDVPPDARIPPALFDHLAERSALFVLDNLEQVDGAGSVVAEMLDQTPGAVIVATSRRPLRVVGEHQHAVPPLELPDDASLEQAEQSGAVQLFVHHARAVKSTFALTDANAADVTAVCERLDGLPLAIELAGARSKVLSPTALLARLDKALDLTAFASGVPSRQRTLRDTIAWSYQLLSPSQQAFFRRLGVFAGGADLEAVAAVAADVVDAADPLEMVADLVDASLVTIGEDGAGEPRVGMFETIRAYAVDRLRAAGETDQARHAHAAHYLNVVEQVSATLESGGVERLLQARARLTSDHDNLREALSWALNTDSGAPPGVTIALRMCAKLGSFGEPLESFWEDGGYYAEGRRWLERVIAVADGEDSAELANCLLALAWLVFEQGDHRQAGVIASRALAVSRRLVDGAQLVRSLISAGMVETEGGHLDRGRESLHQAVALAEQADDRHLLARALTSLAHAEGHAQDHERSLELHDASLRILVEVGDEVTAVGVRHNRACTLREMGRASEAESELRSVVPVMLRTYDPYNLINAAEDYAAMLAELGDYRGAARLLGAAEARRSGNATPRHSSQQAQIAEPLAKARSAVTAETWEGEYRAGYSMTVEEALAEAAGSQGS
jgi:predicted ATPase/class 3 adenylate cyclase